MNRKYKRMNIDGNMANIDLGCVNLVKFFNDIGLKTYMCCEGHDERNNFRIIFDKTVLDDDIKNFVKIYGKYGIEGHFEKTIGISKRGSRFYEGWRYVNINKRTVKEDEDNFAIIRRQIAEGYKMEGNVKVTHKYNGIPNPTEILCECENRMFFYSNGRTVDMILYCDKCDKFYDAEMAECHGEYIEVNLSYYKKNKLRKIFKQMKKDNVREYSLNWKNHDGDVYK